MRSRWRFDEASALKSRAVHPALGGARDSGVARFIAGRGIVACAEPKIGRVVGKPTGGDQVAVSNNGNEREGRLGGFGLAGRAYGKVREAGTVARSTPSVTPGPLPLSTSRLSSLSTISTLRDRPPHVSCGTPRRRARSISK